MTKTVKQQCHDLRNEVHAELKEFQVLVTKVKNLDDLKTLQCDLKELQKSTKESIIKKIQETL